MSSGDSRQRGEKGTDVLDPAWEDALRAGQAEEGLSGSVEPELAIVHLFRHARAPEPLDDARFDRAWGSIEGELDRAAPVPWWKRPWTLVGGTAAVAAAAAVVLVVVLPKASGPDTGGGPIAELGAESGELGGQADALERQFQILAPGARDRVAVAVDQGRGKMRDDLLAMALKSGGGTLGGAP
jgi:hypothetical protein